MANAPTNVKIKMLKSCTYRNATTGSLTSLMTGHVYELLDTVAGNLISSGLAEAYTLITPTGNIEITGNTAQGETIDVSQYATATVDVQAQV